MPVQGSVQWKYGGSIRVGGKRNSMADLLLAGKDSLPLYIRTGQPIAQQKICFYFNQQPWPTNWNSRGKYLRKEATNGAF